MSQRTGNEAPGDAETLRRDFVPRKCSATVPVVMSSVHRVLSAAFLTASLLFLPVSAMAQGAPPDKGGDQKPAANQQGDAAKEAAKKIDEFEEASRVLEGAAGHPECVWLGRRAVSLLWRDDLDTAFRHLDLYDRFGCPGGHVQATFRCVIRQGNIDPKSPESLNARVHACWINPQLQPTPAATAAQPAQPNQPAGTKQ